MRQIQNKKSSKIKYCLFRSGSKAKPCLTFLIYFDPIEQSQRKANEKEREKEIER